MPDQTENDPAPLLRRDDSEDPNKLIPEWRVAADDQIVVVALAVLLAIAAVWLWNDWRDGDGVVAGVAGDSTVAAVIDPEDEVEPAVVVPATTTTTEAEVEETTTTTEAEVLDLETPTLAALNASGVVDAGASAAGTAVTVTGIVGNQGEHDAAIGAATDAAEAVTPDATIIDELRILQPEVQAALVDSGVSAPGAEVTGTVATLAGTVTSEADKTAAGEAAAAVPGVTEVINNITVEEPVTNQLNELLELEPIQFATSSDEILGDSLPTLDQAAEILASADYNQLEVQGYTDVRGDDAFNLALSQDRAQAVVDYLVGKGIAADSLVAKGYGETTQFDPEGADSDSDEALAANRRIEFVLLS